MAIAPLFGPRTVRYMTNETRNTKSPLSAPERFDHLGDFDLADAARSVLPATNTCSKSVLAELTILEGRLSKLFASNEPRAAVDRFLSEVDGWEDRLDRYAVLHILDLAFGSTPKETRWPDWVPCDPNQSKRPLRPLELALVRLIARSDIPTKASLKGKTKVAKCSHVDRVVLVAAAMAGADSGELAYILPSAPEVIAGRVTGNIDLPGGRRSPNASTDDSAPQVPGPTSARPRTATLPAWTLQAVEARLVVAANYPQAPLLYTGQSTSIEKIQSSLLMNLSSTLKLAGLGGDKSVSPLSIRNGAARERYDETGSIEVVAAMLGYGDLNLTQRHIGLRKGLVKRIR